MTGGLPQGWTQVALGDVVTVLDRMRVPLNKAERDKRPGRVPYYGATGQVGWIDKPLFDEELLLLGEDGAPFIDPRKPKSYVVRGPSWINNHAHVLRGLDGLATNLYLKHYLDFVDYRPHVTGTTRLKLTQRAMRSIPIRLPPVTEQERIVTAIEEHFTRLDAASDAITAAQARIEASRRSVLAEAFTGRLASQNPNDEPASVLLERIAANRRNEPAARRTNPRPSPVTADLPPGWAWARLEDLAAAEPRAITDGPFGSNLKTAHYTNGGPRVIRLQNVGDGVFRHEDAHISDEHYLSLVQHSVQEGDLVVASLGETLPRACLVPNWVPPAIVKADCIRVRLHSDLNPSYINFALQRPDLRHETVTHIKGVGRPRLGLKGIKSLAVPVAPLAEQTRIVSAIEEHFSRLDAASDAITAAQARIEASRRSVLAEAFSGRLVQQDPNDEPSSVLLDRIAASRPTKSNRQKVNA